jgi:hypothetical protein
VLNYFDTVRQIQELAPYGFTGTPPHRAKHELFEPLVRWASVRLKLVARKRFLLVLCIKYHKNVKYLVVRRASWHAHSLALQIRFGCPGQADSP